MLRFDERLTQEEIDDIEGEPPESLQRIKPFNVLKEMKKCKKDEINRIEEGKARFGRRMKMPNKGTENKEGHPYGDTNGYYPWDRFPPGGGNK